MFVHTLQRIHVKYPLMIIGKVRLLHPVMIDDHTLTHKRKNLLTPTNNVLPKNYSVAGR